MSGLGAVIGYAVGTAQVLFVDWWRRVTAHKKHLRLLQSELRRLRTFEAKFNWEDGLPPDDGHIPAPPSPTDLFVRTIGDMDWQLTDEHQDDNSQQSFLHLVDGSKMLRYYADKMSAIEQRAPMADKAEMERLRRDGSAYAAVYDAKLDEFLFLIDDALRDVRRRLELTTFGTQLDRAFAVLPRGKNPEPLAVDDARLRKWRQEKTERR